MYIHLLPFAVALSYILPHVSSAGLGYAVDYPNGLSPEFDAGLYSKLIAPHSTHKQWAHGTIPQACKDAATGFTPTCAPTDMEVFNVAYVDCAKPWQFCRCKEAELSIDTMITLFGKMPVNMRSLIRTVIALPDTTSINLLAENFEIIFQGGANVMSAWLYTTGYHLDIQGLTVQTSKVSPRFSTTAAWLNAFKEDTCVPDALSNLDQKDNFAQEVVVEQYWIANGNVIPTETKPHCLHNQRVALENQFRKDFMTPNVPATCSFRYLNSATVSMTSKREALPAAEADIVADVEARAARIRMIEVTEDYPMAKMAVYNYPFSKAKNMIRGMTRK